MCAHARVCVGSQYVIYKGSMNICLKSFILLLERWTLYINGTDVTCDPQLLATCTVHHMNDAISLQLKDLDLPRRSALPWFFPFSCLHFLSFAGSYQRFSSSPLGFFQPVRRAEIESHPLKFILPITGMYYRSRPSPHHFRVFFCFFFLVFIFFYFFIVFFPVNFIML